MFFCCKQLAIERRQGKRLKSTGTNKIPPTPRVYGTCAAENQWSFTIIVTWFFLLLLQNHETSEKKNSGNKSTWRRHRFLFCENGKAIIGSLKLHWVINANECCIKLIPLKYKKENAKT